MGIIQALFFGQQPPRREALLAEYTASPGTYVTNVQPFFNAPFVYRVIHLGPGNYDVSPIDQIIDPNDSFPFGLSVIPDHVP